MLGMLTCISNSANNDRKVAIMAKNPKTIWGWVSVVASSIPAVGAGVVHGTYNSLTGQGTFEEGFEHTSDVVMDACTDFADEHADALTKTAITATGAILANKANTDYNNKHKPK